MALTTPGGAAHPSGHTQTLADDPLGGTVRRTVLPSGLRILTEAVPAMRSVSAGAWVGVGSRDEPPQLSGASHFLEHLLFKGTRRRSAWDISAAIESVGGDTNAFTTKEYTCFHARVLDTHTPLAIDVLCDLLTDSVLAAEDVETERGVILEEIAMQDDEPAEEVHDLFAGLVYGDHPLGRRISGTTASIAAMTRRQILGFYRRRYRAPSVVLTFAGNLDHDAVVAHVRDALVGTALDGPPASPAPPRAGDRPARDRSSRGRGAGPLRKARTAADTAVVSRETEQAHLVLGRPAMARDDDRRFALGVLDNLLGGGMSSRLFQRIREERGLAYATYSFTTRYADSGLFGVYAGCAPGKVEEVAALVRDELTEVVRHGVRDEELARGKGMLAGSMVLDLEDTGSRMSRLGRQELLYAQPLSVDESLRRVDAVTREEVHELASQVLAGPLWGVAIGPVDSLVAGSVG